MNLFPTHCICSCRPDISHLLVSSPLYDWAMSLCIRHLNKWPTVILGCQHYLDAIIVLGILFGSAYFYLVGCSAAARRRLVTDVMPASYKMEQTRNSKR